MSIIDKPNNIYEMLRLLQSIEKFENYRLIVYTDESGHIEDNRQEPFITFNDLEEGLFVLREKIYMTRKEKNV